tara:strand:- start:190 stop:324 length:135 start_codon:yes stop_codon:yes gene_type:complete
MIKTRKLKTGIVITEIWTKGKYIVTTSDDQEIWWNDVKNKYYGK